MAEDSVTLIDDEEPEPYQEEPWEDEPAEPSLSVALPLEDGLEEVILAKEWDDNPANSCVRVDPARAAWLRSHGYAVVADQSRKNPSKRGRKKG